MRPGARRRAGLVLLAAIGYSEHVLISRPAATPRQGATLSTGYRPIAPDGALRELVHHCSQKLQTLEDASGPTGKGLHQGTRVVGTDLNDRTFTENVKIGA